MAKKVNGKTERSAKRSSRSSNQTVQQSSAPDGPILTKQQEELLQWFKTVKFRKAFIGGIDERSMWKKLEQLNELYEKAILSERARYDAMLNAYKTTANKTIANYKNALNAEQEQNQLLAQKLAEMTAVGSEGN